MSRGAEMSKEFQWFRFQLKVVSNCIEQVDDQDDNAPRKFDYFWGLLRVLTNIDRCFCVGNLN